MRKVDGEWKLAHRIKKTHAIYSSPVTNRPLVFDTYRKAELALKPTSNGNYLPEGTIVVELKVNECTCTPKFPKLRNGSGHYEGCPMYFKLGGQSA